MMADLLKNTVISLKQSLVYTLSLGDKELFHSNVLGWLLENHNDKGIQPIVKLFINDELEIERVEREKNHFDLCVICHKKNNEADKHFVILENKFCRIKTNWNVMKLYVRERRIKKIIIHLFFLHHRIH